MLGGPNFSESFFAAGKYLRKKQAKMTCWSTVKKNHQIFEVGQPKMDDLLESFDNQK